MKTFDGQEIFDSIYNVEEFQELQRLIQETVEKYPESLFGTKYSDRLSLIKELCTMYYTLDRSTGCEFLHPKFVTDRRSNGKRYQLWLKCFENWKQNEKYYEGI